MFAVISLKNVTCVNYTFRDFCKIFADSKCQVEISARMGILVPVKFYWEFLGIGIFVGCNYFRADIINYFQNWQICRLLVRLDFGAFEWSEYLARRPGGQTR